MKIGIFGGTFNPPHIGHFTVANFIVEHFALDKLFFIPTFSTPLKDGNESALVEDRLQMVNLMAAKNAKFESLEIEIQRKGNSYTIDTLREIKKNFPSSEVFLFIGADNYLSFHLWKEPEAILKLATLVVMTRPNFLIKRNPKFAENDVKFIEVPAVNISSTEIRKKVYTGEKIDKDVLPEIEMYIKGKNLYK